MSKQAINDQITEKKPNPFVWFFFAILIPVIVAIIITIVILSIAGVDIGAWAKETGSKIPVVSSFVQTDEEKDIGVIEEKHNVAIEKKDQQISELEETVEEQALTIEQLTSDALKLEQKLKSNVELTDDGEIKEEDGHSQTIKEMASSYRKMNAKQAAKILEEMDRSIALDILHELSNDVRGKIIEEMSAENAVEITEQYIKQAH